MKPKKYKTLYGSLKSLSAMGTSLSLCVESCYCISLMTSKRIDASLFSGQTIPQTIQLKHRVIVWLLAGRYKAHTLRKCKQL